MIKAQTGQRKLPVRTSEDRSIRKQSRESFQLTISKREKPRSKLEGMETKLDREPLRDTYHLSERRGAKDLQ